MAPAAFYGLWHAPHELSGAPLLGYMLTLLVLLRISVSVFDVPNNALMPELAPDYHERTNLMAYRFFFNSAGAAVLTMLLYSVFLRRDAAHPLGILNREGYSHECSSCGFWLGTRNVIVGQLTTSSHANSRSREV